MVTYHTHRTVVDYWVSDKAWPQTSLGMDWVQGQSGQVIKIYLFCNEYHFTVCFHHQMLHLFNTPPPVQIWRLPLWLMESVALFDYQSGGCSHWGSQVLSDLND